MAEANSVSADGAFYDKMGEDYQHAFTHDEVLQESVQQFLDLLPKTASILDCGSGTGKPVAELMANSGRTVYGIDQSPGMVALSKKQVPTGHFELQNMLTYDPSVQFDGVVASLSMFEHSRGNVEAMTRNFSRWLRPGGHLLIATFPAEEARQATPETYDPDGQCAQKIPGGLWATRSRSPCSRRTVGGFCYKRTICGS